MIHLFVVRHGDAPFTTVSDHERPLSDLGMLQAQQAGHFIASHVQAPYRVVCSDATRTRQTAHAICQVLSTDHVTAYAHLYQARVGDWCDQIHQHSNEQHWVLVGHNPTMSHLAKYLSPSDSRIFSPACVGYYQLEIASDGLKLPARLIDFFIPDAK